MDIAQLIWSPSKWDTNKLERMQQNNYKMIIDWNT